MKTYRRTSLIAIFCGAILAGVGLSRRISFLPPWELWLAVSPVVFGLRRRNLVSLYLVILLGVGLGLARGTLYMDKLHDIQKLANHKVAIIGTASGDAVYGKNQQLDFNLINIRNKFSGQPLAGNFQVSGFGLPMVYRGDRVEVTGKIYPTRGSHQANISYASLSLIGHSNDFVSKLTRHFNTGVQNALPEPQASFALGLLIGQRSNLPSDILAQLTAVGLIHIVAVSGYNVTILSRAVARLRLGSRYQRLILSLGLIGLFVMVTGFSASIVRAAIVSALSLLAWYYGRTFRPILLIAFTAALTGLINPFYVWGDLSWYLSFLAFFGVMIVAPILQARFFRREPKLATAVLLESLSAELMTLPLILTYFSQLSLISPLANLLVVPMVPLAMLLSAIAGVAGAVVPALAGWVAWPATVLLTYMLDIAHLLSQLPIALYRVSAGGGVMAVFYILLLVVGAATRKAAARLSLTP